MGKVMKSLLLVSSFVVLGGCGGHEVVTPTVNVSVGQQLIDLKKARDSGALTDRDYIRQKEQLIDSVK